MENELDQPPPERSEEPEEAVCWECGARTACHAYVTCGGAVYHLCPRCEERIAEEQAAHKDDSGDETGRAT